MVTTSRLIDDLCRALRSSETRLPLLLGLLCVACRDQHAERYAGPLAAAALAVRATSSDWHCDTTYIAPGSGLTPPFISCTGRRGDTVTGVMTDTTGRVVNLVRQLNWNPGRQPGAGRAMIEAIESRLGRGRRWCDADGLAYAQVWEGTEYYQVLVVDSARGLGNLTATLGSPYCTDSVRRPESPGTDPGAR